MPPLAESECFELSVVTTHGEGGRFTKVRICMIIQNNNSSDKLIGQCNIVALYHIIIDA